MLFLLYGQNWHLDNLSAQKIKYLVFIGRFVQCLLGTEEIKFNY